MVSMPTKIMCHVNYISVDQNMTMVKIGLKLKHSECTLTYPWIHMNAAMYGNSI